MDASEFVHLHVHTEYSLLDGSSKIGEIVHQARELGMNALAITDHGVMYGCIDFYKACLAEGIKPIIGCEVYVAPGSRFDREEKGGAKYDHLILLCENNQGYENLMRLVSLGFIDGYYYRPRIDFELLTKYHEGLIATSACVSGIVARPLLTQSYETAKAVAQKYKDLFGPDHFYLELQDHTDETNPDETQKQVNQGLLRLSRDLDLPLVVTNDVHYTFKSDREAHEILLCIQTGKKLSDPDHMVYLGDYSLRSPEEMTGLFPYVPEAAENTRKIADRCHVEIKFHERKLPSYDVPQGMTASQMLRSLCAQGLKERYADCDPDAPGYDPAKARYPWKDLKDRLEYEISVIEKMGFVDYFLIVWDFIHFARQKGIKVGPGRGSAVGSLTAYTLYITSVEPLEYHLIFERMLNPERVSMPDIDTDFCDRRRQEVIDYVTQKYGADRVAQIVTFGTMAARQVIRDVGRVMDMPYADVDKISKMIPNELKITIDLALEKNPDLKALYDSDGQVRKLIDMGKRLEGLPRHTSTHAAGVLISGDETMKFVPLCTNDGNVVTQYPMNTLEELGLLKMDFLGLRTLTVLEDAVDMVHKDEGISLDLDNMAMDDPAVYEMIGAGKTEGVFQLESSGMTQFMRELKPERMEDIIAGISLYRPGPMDFIPKYLAGKKDPSSITYKTPLLKPILEPTYGCIVYQEQVMQIVRDLAGYTMGRSDLVRRAMAKKKTDVMAKERHNFVYGNPEENVPGCVSRGIAPEVAESIFDEMTDFAHYAFNKSHATAYAVVAYQTAYLKCYYPTEFMAAIMTSVIGMPHKVVHYMQSLRTMGISLLPPDINEGWSGFSVSIGKDQSGKREKKIRYGLSCIKNVGVGLIEGITAEREKDGPFRSMTDFCRRVPEKDMNKRAMENLIKAGAFDSLGGRRAQYLQAYPLIMDSASTWKKSTMGGQMDLFGFGSGDAASPDENTASDDPLPDIPELSDEVRLSYEKDVLGVYLTGHPLDKDSALMDQWITNPTSDFAYEDKPEDDPGTPIEEQTVAPSLYDGQMVTVGGLIQHITLKSTKNNKMMAFIEVEDLYGTVEVLVFPNRYEVYKPLLTEDRKVFVRGRVSVEEQADAKILCEVIAPFEHPETLNERPAWDKGPRGQKEAPSQASQPAPLWLRFHDQASWDGKKEEVCAILRRDPGSRPIRIYLEKEKQMLKGSRSLSTAGTQKTLSDLRLLIGGENVR